MIPEIQNVKHVIVDRKVSYYNTEVIIFTTILKLIIVLIVYGIHL
jgi:hypothetical protein